MSIPQNKPLPIKRDPQFTNETNNIKNPEMGFIPSSWNYGSFHQTNPRYTKIEREREKEKEKPVKLLIKENQEEKNLFSSNLISNYNKKTNTNTNTNININKFGKRILNNEEKIVTEDLLKAMNDNKNIRGTSRKLSQTRSSSNLKQKKNQREKENSNFTQENYTETNTYENQQIKSQNERNSSYSNNNNNYNNTNKKNYYNNNNNNYNNQNLLNRSRASSAKTRDSNIEKKTYKFGMTYDEWNENKSRHVKIAKTLNLIKEERLKEIEIYDNQINQKYIEAK
jgi:hypothetical protein